ncbi:hypothetical protein [Sphingomonas sanxanigenens]|nr:hypothetical protein [Sphingomonas sanxanigenens]
MPRPPFNDPVQRSFEPVFGHPAWGVSRGHGSFLTMEFGDPELVVHEWPSGLRRSVNVHGAWHLWIYCCRWTLSDKGGRLAERDDADGEIDRAVHLLNGQKLIGVEIDRTSAETRFLFDLGGLLATSPNPNNSDDPDVQWKLMTAETCFKVRADGCFSLGSMKARPGEESWERL